VRLVGRRVDALNSIWRERHHDFDKRKYVVDLIRLTFIDGSGEDALLEMMSDGVKFIDNDVYTKHLLQPLCRQLAQAQARQQETSNHQRRGPNG
jgi:hypothetical protein